MQYWSKVLDGFFRRKGRIGGYALVRDGRCLLIDPPRGDWPAALAELGVVRADWILATHHHRDSLAGADELVAGGARLFVPAGEVDLVARAETFWHTARTYVLYDCDSRFSALRQGIAVHAGVTPGQVLALGPWDVAVLSLRGPTRHHTGYVLAHEGRRLAFVGDSMAGNGAVHNWCDFHWDYMDFNKGHRALLEDLEGLALVAPDVLCPSHAPVLADATAQIDSLRVNLGRFIELVEPNRVPRQRDELYQVLPHLWFLGQTCYGIVAADGTALLFDVGYFDPTRSRLSEFCRLADVKRIEAIAFSHYHDDHCWRATEVAYGCSGTTHDAPRAQIWSHRSLAEIFEAPERFRYPCLMPDAMRLDRVFDDEAFDFHGIPMQYVFLPGQTYWHAGLIADIDGRRVAFTGDNIWRPHTRQRPIVGPIISRNRYLPGVNHCLAARRLLEANVNLIAPAHGEVFDVTAEDLAAHRDWADVAAAAVEALAGGERAGIDCWWCRIDPFHIHVGCGCTVDVKVIVDLPFRRAARVDVRLNLPTGFAARAMQDSMYVTAGGSESVAFRLTAPDAWTCGRRLPLTVDLMIDGELWPEQAEALLIPSPAREQPEATRTPPAGRVR